MTIGPETPRLALSQLAWAHLKAVEPTLAGSLRAAESLVGRLFPRRIRLQNICG
jgi:hypothetical protein